MANTLWMSEPICPGLKNATSARNVRALLKVSFSQSMVFGPLCFTTIDFDIKNKKIVIECKEIYLDTFRHVENVQKSFLHKILCLISKEIDYWLSFGHFSTDKIRFHAPYVH